MAKGTKTGGGSRKGRPNKLTAEVKAMVLDALDCAGGVDYLTRQAENNPVAFMSLLGRIIPTQVAANPDGQPVTLVVNTGVPPAIADIERDG
jgi:hypothetical protein